MVVVCGCEYGMQEFKFTSSYCTIVRPNMTTSLLFIIKLKSISWQAGEMNQKVMHLLNKHSIRSVRTWFRAPLLLPSSMAEWVHSLQGKQISVVVWFFHHHHHHDDRSLPISSNHCFQRARFTINYGVTMLLHNNCWIVLELSIHSMEMCSLLFGKQHQ